MQEWWKIVLKSNEKKRARPSSLTHLRCTLGDQFCISQCGKVARIIC